MYNYMYGQSIMCGAGGDGWGVGGGWGWLVCMCVHTKSFPQALWSMRCDFVVT